jgi:hypothetical protein
MTGKAMRPERTGDDFFIVEEKEGVVKRKVAGLLRPDPA